MKGVVVVRVVPVDRARRHKAFLVGGGRIGHRLDHRLLHFRVVEVQFAVLADDVLAAIGDHEIIEHVVGIDPVGGDVETEAIDVAHARLAQALLHLLEEIVIGIPGLRDVRHLVAGLLDQWPPNMVGQHVKRQRNAVQTALFLNAIVAIDVEQRGFGVLLALGRHDVGHIDQLVVPGEQSDDLGRVVGEKIRDDAAGHRRDDLLALRRERRDVELDLVAAGLLVIRDNLFERRILFLDKALRPPDLRGRRCCVGYIRPPQGSGAHQAHRAVKQRTPRQMPHFRLSPCSGRERCAAAFCFRLNPVRSGISRKSPRPA